MSQYYQDEESATLQDVPESPRMTLLATVVGAKRQEARWGKPGSSYLSITVLCESDAGRFKLHGRCPSKVERDIDEARKLGDSKASVVGSLIEFSAETRRSENDPKFGYFKRATKPRTLVPGQGGKLS